MARGVSSQWEDIQVKLGNFAPREKVATAEEIFQQNVEEAEAINPLEGKRIKDLDDMLEDDDDDEFLNEFRKKRLAELEELSKKPKFGTLYEINKQEFVAEVNNAPQDVYVVLHLYQDWIPECKLLNQILTNLAKKFPFTKFLKIVANKCIENFRDNDAPAIIIYKNGQLTKQIIPAGPLFGGKKMNQNTVEWVLALMDVFETDLLDDPREDLSRMQIKKTLAAKDDESDSDDDRGYTSNKIRPKYK